MEVKLEDRPLEQVREEVIDQLIYNYSHGVISAEAFERRLDDAMKTDDPHKIIALVADLPLAVDKQYQDEKETVFTPNYSHQQSTDDDKLISILGSNERSGKWLVPKEISIVDVLGATKLDFTDAVFQHQHVTINVLCVLGENKIYVPENVNVVSKISSILSEVDNSSTSLATKQAPTITIIGKVILGALKVKKKSTTKEMWVGFANNLKALFGESNKY